MGLNELDTTFDYEGKTQVWEQYTDYEFTDGNPRHLYSLTYDSKNEEWYGVLLISETDDGPFDADERYMTDEEIKCCKALIPLFDRPERMLHRGNI